MEAFGVEAFGVGDSVVVLAVSVVEDVAGVLAVLAVLAALEASLFKHCFDCSKIPGKYLWKGSVPAGFGEGALFLLRLSYWTKNRT